MTSDDRPPMPASPPPAHEPPPAPAPPPPPAVVRPGELVDSVPGVTPAEPAADLLGGLILPSDLPTWAPPAPPAPPSLAAPPAPAGPAAAGESAPAEPVPDEGDAGDTIPVSTFLSQLAEAHQRPEASAEPPAPAESAEFDAGDTIAAPAGSFDHLILPPEPTSAAAEETQRGFPSQDPATPAPATPNPATLATPADEPTPAPAPPGFAPPGFSPPPGFTPPAGFEPPSGFQGPEFAPPGFAPPGFAPPGYSPPGSAAESDFGLAAPTIAGGALRFQPPAAGGAHAGDNASGGRGKLAALIGGVIVVVALIVGGILLFHGGSKKTPVAAPTPRAVVSTVPSPAPSTVPSAAPSVAPTSAAPSPTVDAALAGTQAKALQNTIIKPLKSLVALDASSAGAEEACMDQSKAFASRGTQRSSILAMLRKLDVTAMQDNKTWKGLLEQAMLKDITVDKELTAFATDLKTTCKPATAKNDAHYKKAIAAHEASLGIQKQFVAAFNPVAKTYHIPQQSAGNI